ncbi:MAG TPA: hypothetical protein VN345_12920 [Blastocatellia bacterium]|nr:hypothetical protein [Blastocatellia bacterium]
MKKKIKPQEDLEGRHARFAGRAPRARKAATRRRTPKASPSANIQSPLIGIMDADELEDYLEQQDPQSQRQIEENHRDYLAGKSRPATELLAELRR